MGGSRSGNHDEFAFEFIVGLCMRRGKAHGEKSTRRAIKTEPSITPITNALLCQSRGKWLAECWKRVTASASLIARKSGMLKTESVKMKRAKKLQQDTSTY
jgi:hypothetical protein